MYDGEKEGKGGLWILVFSAYFLSLPILPKPDCLTSFLRCSNSWKAAFATKEMTQKCLKGGYSFTVRRFLSFFFFFSRRQLVPVGEGSERAAQLPTGCSPASGWRGPRHHHDFHRQSGTGQQPVWNLFPLPSQATGQEKLLLSLDHFPSRTKIKLFLEKPLSAADYFPFKNNHQPRKQMEWTA